MDDIIKRASERLAGETSRRGFVSMLAKVAAGAAGLLTVSAFPHDTEAASLNCCGGTPCSSSSCPSNAPVNSYTWQCGAQNQFHCHDCFTSRGTYVCTYRAHS